MWTLIQNSNILVIIYLISAAIIFFYGWFLNIFSHRLFFPAFFSEVTQYGKLIHNKKLTTVSSWLQIPKRWFLHFYLFAVTEALCSILLFWTINCFELELPYWLQYVFDLLTLPDRVTTIHSHTAYIVLCLYSVHVTKRLLENVYLSIFSSSTMNIFHYLLGHYHYAATFTLLLALFPGISALDPVHRTSLMLESIFQVSGIMMFLTGSYFQYDSLQRLAALRLSKESYNKYFIPVGGLFNFISCPHMLCEIVIYTGIAVIMGFRHKYFNVVCLFVICNQIQIAVMNHQWYKKKFKDYPRKRKAILPYLL